MTIAKDQEFTQPSGAAPEPAPEIIYPPSDLYSDEPPLETYLHLRQLILMLTCLEWYWHERNDFFAAGNLTIYYSLKQLKSEDFRGPDLFVVLNTERRPRKSWVVWEEEGKYPNVIVELLSNTTAKTDRGLKKQIYQDTFRTPEYFWFDPNNLEFRGFVLVRGQYQDIQPDERGWMWSDQLHLFLGIEEDSLRFFTPAGELVLSPTESAQREQQQRQIAEQQRQVAEDLLTQYRQRFGELD
jgi:Uma2 family endonuclease